LLASFGIMDKTARDQLVTTLFLPVPMLAALALGIALGGHRLLALAGGEEVHANIELTGYARLSGRVLTNAGAHPVPGVLVTLLDTTGASVAVAEADEAGWYAFEGLAEGEYTALASGFPPVASALHITGADVTVRHDIELKHIAS
jgi:hypothetical protein